MKKNNRGFTIVELICTILLLTIILLVAYPNFSKLTTIAESKYDSSEKILAKAAAKIYVNNNQEEIDSYLSSNQKYCLPLGKLSAYDYLDTNLKDSKGNEINMRQCVNITKITTDGKVKYNYELSEKDLIDENIDYIPPILTLRKKEGSTKSCSFVMNATSKEEFTQNCEVVATDNISSKINIDVEEHTNLNSVILKYSAVDDAGNKAIPIKIKLVIN